MHRARDGEDHNAREAGRENQPGNLRPFRLYGFFDFCRDRDTLDRMNKLIPCRGIVRINRCDVDSSPRADLRDTDVEAAFEIDESFGWPEALTQIFAGDQFARPREQRAQNA